MKLEHQVLLLLLLLTLITPAVVPKRHTLFEMISWNNFVWLNMCQAVLNVKHFEGQWVWLSYNINFYKDGTPQAPTSVHPGPPHSVVWGATDHTVIL